MRISFYVLQIFPVLYLKIVYATLRIPCARDAAAHGRWCTSCDTSNDVSFITGISAHDFISSKIWCMLNPLHCSVAYVHIHEHCFNYALYMSVSWDVVEWNFFFHPTLSMFRATSATIHNNKNKTKIEFSSNNYSDIFHSSRALSLTWLASKWKFVSTWKRRQHQITDYKDHHECNSKRKSK